LTSCPRRGNGIPEDKQEQDRHHECQSEAQRVSPYLDELFLGDSFDAQEFHKHTFKPTTELGAQSKIKTFLTGSIGQNQIINPVYPALFSSLSLIFL
jgi:hypothetical protein